jgi:MFS family permease
MRAAPPLSIPDPASSGVTTDAAAPTDDRIWIVLGLAVTAQTAGSIVSQGVYTLVPFWKEAFGLSQASAAAAVTVMNAGQILSMISLGRAIDRHGERAVVALTMTAMGAMALLAAALATTWPVLLALLLALGAFYASVQPGGTRAILRWFPPQHRGLATGFRQAAVPLGTAIAALLLPMLTAAHGWQAAVAAQGIIGIAGGGLFWLFYREEGTEPAVTRGAQIPMGQLVRTLGATHGFRLVLAAGIAMSAFQFTFTAHAISFMAEGLGLGLMLAASLFAATQVVGIPGRVMLPWLSDRLWSGRRARSLGWMMAACTAATAALLLLPPDAPAWMLWGVLGTLGLFGIGWFPLYILQIAEMAPKTAIASTVSLATTLCMVAMSLAPWLFGLVVDLSGYPLAWSVLIAPVALLAAPLCRLPSRPPV